MLVSRFPVQTISAGGLTAPSGGEPDRHRAPGRDDGDPRPGDHDALWFPGLDDDDYEPEPEYGDFWLEPDDDLI